MSGPGPRARRACPCTLEVRAALEGLAGIEEHASQFADVPAWWVDGREFAHIGPEGWLDLRLTRRLIRERRQSLRQEARFRLRAAASDWLEIRISGGLDDTVSELLGLAAEANRPAALDRAPDPARVVARARRLHQRK